MNASSQSTISTSIRIVVILFLLAVVCNTGINARPASAATVVLYQNNFESPLVPLSQSCGIDIDAGSVNSHYGPEFKQQNTVETLMINGPQHLYSDPSGIGGKYALGMLSTVNDDKLALTFNSQGSAFINFQLDVSPIDLKGCGGPFGVAAPVFKISLVDSPGGTFNFNSGKVLDTTTITGTAPLGSYTFNWTSHTIGLHTTGTTDGKVTLVVDLLQSGYAALDNFVIVASDISGTSDTDLDSVVDLNDQCIGTTFGLAVDTNGCPTVAAIVAASNAPANGGYDQDDLTGAGLVNIVGSKVAAYEESIATAGPAPTTLASLQTIIDAVNDPTKNTPPTLTVSGSSTYTENNPPLLIAPSLSISDSDGGMITSASVSIGTGFGAAEDRLGISGQNGTSGTISGLVWSYNVGTGVLNFSGNASPAIYQSVLRQVTYSNISENPSAATRTIQIVLGDPGLGVSGSMTVAVTPVNDAPTLSSIGILTGAREDTPFTISYATLAAASNSADGDNLNLSFRIEAVNSGTLTKNGVAIVPGVTLVSSGESLVWTPDANANSPALNAFTVVAYDGTLVSIPAVQVRVEVASVNDAPTLGAIGDVSITENAPLTTVALAGIGSGAPNENNQSLTITAVSSNPALVANPTVTYTSPEGTATLAFTTQAGLYGSAIISVTVTDSGSGVAPNINSVTQTFVVFVGNVNHRPTIDEISDIVVLEDAGVQTVALTGISLGAPNEGNQQLTITATSSDPALVPNPSLAYTSPNATGSLVFAPTADMNGTATITVTLRDNGGTINGGIDTLVRTFTIQVLPVNDAPRFTPGPNQRVAVNAEAQSIEGWASDFVAGPSDERDQALAEYRIVSNSDSSLFAVAPDIDVNGTLSYTPQPGARGSATIGVVVRDDGGVASGGSDISEVQTFTISIGTGYQLYIPTVRR